MAIAFLVSLTLISTFFPSFGWAQLSYSVGCTGTLIVRDGNKIIPYTSELLETGTATPAHGSLKFMHAENFIAPGSYQYGLAVNPKALTTPNRTFIFAEPKVLVWIRVERPTHFEGTSCAPAYLHEDLRHEVGMEPGGRYVVKKIILSPSSPPPALPNVGLTNRNTEELTSFLVANPVPANSIELLQLLQKVNRWCAWNSYDEDLYVGGAYVLSAYWDKYRISVYRESERITCYVRAWDTPRPLTMGNALWVTVNRSDLSVIEWGKKTGRIKTPCPDEEKGRMLKDSVLSLLKWQVDTP